MVAINYCPENIFYKSITSSCMSASYACLALYGMIIGLMKCDEKAEIGRISEPAQEQRIQTNPAKPK